MKVNIKNNCVIAKHRVLNVNKIHLFQMIKTIYLGAENFDCFDTYDDDQSVQMGCDWLTSCLSQHEIRVQ